MSNGPLSPFRADVLRGLFALALLAAPLWAPMLHLGDPTYEYERLEVAAEGDGIAYADERPAGIGAISDDIACSGDRDVRACALEHHVATNETVHSQIYTTNPYEPDPFGDGYRYALVDDRLYETSYESNRSNQNDRGLYGVDLALEPADPEEALERMSIDPENPRDDVASVVAEAAREGDVAAREEIDVPQTPVKTDDGYYRVYEADWRDDAPPMHGLVDWLLTYIVPFTGLYLLVGIWGRFEVAYVGDER